MSDDLDDILAKEREMMANLGGEESDVEVAAAPAEEDLEYPDLPGGDVTLAADDLDDLDDLDDIDTDIDIDDDLGLDDIDAELDDDLPDLPGEIPEMEEEVNAALELPDDLLAGDDEDEPAVAMAEDTEEEGLSEDHSGITSKTDLYKLKKKEEAERRRIEREQEELKAAQERKMREEYEAQNIIVDINDLIAQNEIIPVEADEEETADEVEETREKSGVFGGLFGKKEKAQNKDVPETVKAGPPPPPGAADKLAKGSAAPAHQVVYAQPNTSLLKIMVGLIGDILRVGMPLGVLIYYIHDQKAVDNSRQAIQYMMTGETFQIELGLNIIKENMTADKRVYYYDLVKSKVEKEIEQVWRPGALDAFVLAEKVLSLKQYTFSDSTLINLPGLVKKRMLKKEEELRDLYGNFYDTEKETDNTVFLDNLRQGNIFLEQKKCLKALEHFDKAASVMNDSVAVLQGQWLAMHCALDTQPQQVAGYLVKRDALKELYRIRSKNEAGRVPASVPVENIRPDPMPDRLKAKSGKGM